MKTLLALLVGIACLVPLKANAQQVYRLFWVSYYPLNPGARAMVPMDSKYKTTYETLSDCQAAQAKLSPEFRAWANNGYYICLVTNA